MSDYDASNIFAKIIRGELPAHKVYEDDDVVVTMDIFPQSRGHTLVIPKAPSRNLFDADPAVLGRAIAVVQRVALAAKAATGADGVRVQQFNEAPAGQSVFHLHFHVVPMFEGAGLRGHGSGGRADDADLAALAKDIAAHL